MKPKPPDHPNIVLPVPADIDRAYLSKSGAKVTRARSKHHGFGGHKTDAERRADALRTINRPTPCRTQGCRVGANETGWCRLHRKTQRKAMLTPIEQPIPGCCNKRRKERGRSEDGRSSRGSLCRQPEGKCPWHKNVPDLPDYLK